MFLFCRAWNFNSFDKIMTKKEKEVTRHYRLVHQIVSLTGINFQTKSIIG